MRGGWSQDRKHGAGAGGELGGLPCYRVAGVRVAVYRRGKGGERAGGRGGDSSLQ